MSAIPGEQYRIERVQVLNWGSYGGLQVMRVGRKSTAILGPSGRGKSTLLDAIASVIMPNPQEFNQAARDDVGSKRERTVYSYARGLTVNHQDENRRSSTPSYLRPAGGAPFPCGAAITWSTGTGEQATAFRLAWVASDATDKEAIGKSTVYGFVRGYFDFAKLDGLTPARDGSGPLSPESLRQLIDTERGDVVDRKQKVVHTKLRAEMQLGDTEESQRRAMQLLRRAQASKGIFSINDLFKEFVLTEPKALTRWDITLEHYTEVSRLYDEFELARRKLDSLKDLPLVAEQYRAAGQGAVDKRAILRVPPGGGIARLQVWHAEKTLDWASRAGEDAQLDRAQAEEDLQGAEALEQQARRKHERAVDALAGDGVDQTGAVRAEIGHVENELQAVQRSRATTAARLAEFGQQLPVSSGDLTLLRQSLTDVHAELAGEEQALSGEHEAAIADRQARAAQINDQKSALRHAEDSRTNIPPEDDQRRRAIADGCGIAPEKLPFIGQLLDIAPTYQGWEKAITSILRQLARDIAVSERDFATVRAYVNSHDLRGQVTLAPARTGQPTRSHPEGTVPAMVDIADGPYQGWLSGQLARFTYECVERDTDLPGPTQPGVVGRVTRSGMRTAPDGRVTKNDTPSRYRWLGRDNQALRTQLAADLDATRTAYDAADKRAGIARQALKEHQARMDGVLRLRDELSWSDLDADAVQARLTELTTELARIDTPENKRRRDEFKTTQDALFAAAQAAEAIRTRLGALELYEGSVAYVRDNAETTVLGNEALTEDERAATASLPFAAPDLRTVDHASNVVDSSLNARVQASYRDAAQRLDEQISNHDQQRDTHERTLLAIIRGYRNINDKTARDIDEHIDSLATLEAIREQLVADDMPRTKNAWLRKMDQDLNLGLRNLLSQIAVDAHDIARGLDPINRVLAGVPFRQRSQLAIEPVEKPNTDLREFRDVILRYTRDSPLGEDLWQDDAKVEASFRQLRDGIDRLTEPGRAGDAWRRRVFDAREHVEFRAIETPQDGRPIIHEGVAGMSGGEGQELIAFILGAALRYRLGEGGEAVPRYGTVVLDEGFVKADSDFTGRALGALQALGFQLIIGAPREKATAFEDYVDVVTYINNDPGNRHAVRVYSMTIEEALRLDDPAPA